MRSNIQDASQTEVFFMASRAEKVGVNMLGQLKRIVDLRRPEAVVSAIKEGQAETAEGTPVFDLSGLGNPVGSCSIGIEGSWRVSFSSAMTREAMRRSGKPDKSVTGTGTYRSGNDATEENVTLEFARPAEGLVAVTISGEPTYVTITGKRLGPDFGRIPPTTLSFQIATPTHGPGGMEN